MDDVLDAAGGTDRAADHAPPRGARAHGRDRPSRLRAAFVPITRVMTSPRRLTSLTSTQTCRIARWLPHPRPVESRKKRPDPRRRLRRHRRGAQAEGRRRRRRPRRQAQLPHLPAAPLPGRDRPARGRRGRASAARPLPRPAQRDRAPRRPRRASTWPRAPCSSRSWTPLAYDYLVLGLGAGVNFFGTEGAAEHAFPMYTLADAVRLRDARARRSGRRPTSDPALIEDGALNVVVVGGGATGIESVGALAELYRSIFSKDYPQIPQEQGAADPRRGRPGALHDVQGGHPQVHESARSRSAASR